MSSPSDTQPFDNLGDSDFPRIDRYKLLQQMGEGGMGVVWMAEQQGPVHRRVALKLIKAGLDTKEVISRIEAERQVLALMDHQNIAKFLDAGTHQGRPYFVMELVPGIPFTRYCDDHRLPLNERMDLFIPVCKAVQHAHQKGIIHRDLKPSNILVTMCDGSPIPKVIDFGLAKVLQYQKDYSRDSTFTELGRAMGTVRYMSPEQAEMNALDIDTRSDVYALGVMLYEILTGSTPIDAETSRRLNRDQLLRLVRERDVQKPSVRLSGSHEVISSISALRQLEPKRLRQILSGELDWIVMKALDRDRTRRYESAGELAADIQRFLRHEPIEARPPSIGYRLSKTFRKHYRAYLTTAALTLTVVAAASQLFRAQRAERELEQLELRRELSQANQRISEEEQARREVEVLKRLTDRQLYAYKINLSRAEWDYGDPSRAIDLLRSTRRDCRGWEYGFLTAQYDRCQHTLLGHDDDVAAVCFNVEGTRIASAGNDKVVRIWDAVTGEQLKVMHGHSGYVWDVDFSPDGSTIASASEDHTAKLWNVQTEKPLRTYDHIGPVDSVRFSGDGTLVVTAGEDRNIKVWDSASGRLLQTLSGHTGRVRSASFNSTASRIVSGGAGKTIRVWDSGTGDEILHWHGHSNDISSVCFSLDDRQILSASWDKTVKVWDANTGQDLRALKGHTGRVSGAVYGPGDLIVSGCWDKTVRVWQASSGNELRRFRGHTDSVDSVAINRGGIHIASGSWDRSVKIWSLASEDETTTLGDGSSPITSVAFSPDGERLVSGRLDGVMGVWNVETQETLFAVSHSSSVWSVEFSADGTNVLSACEDGTLNFWNAETGERTGVFTGSAGRIAVYSPDGRNIVSGHVNGVINIWDAATGAITRPLDGHTAGIWRVAFSSDGKRIVSGAWDNTVRVWDVATGKQTHLLGGHSDLVFDVAFSPDGQHVVSGSQDNSIIIWNLEHDKSQMLTGHTSSVDCVAFSPDGRRIASGSNDGTVKFWDAETGTEVFTLLEHEKRVFDVAFSRDGHRIASASYDGTIIIRRAAPVYGRKPLSKPEQSP